MIKRPRILTYVGVVLAGCGFALIAVAWGKTAGVASVAVQIPDLIAAGFTGVALVVIGVLAISIDVRRIDAAQRRDQAGEFRDLLRDLRQSLDRESK